MIRQWIVAGLMGATALGGVAPSIAGAAEQERMHPRMSQRGDDRDGRSDARSQGRAQSGDARSEGDRQLEENAAPPGHRCLRVSAIRSRNGDAAGRRSG